MWWATPASDAAPVFGDSARQMQGEANRNQDCISKVALRDFLPRISRRKRLQFSWLWWPLGWGGAMYCRPPPSLKTALVFARYACKQDKAAESLTATGILSWTLNGHLGGNLIQVLGPYGWELSDPEAHTPEFRHLCIVFLLCFVKRTTSKYHFLFVVIIFSVFWVFCLLFSFKPFSLFCFFLLILNFVQMRHHLMNRSLIISIAHWTCRIFWAYTT